MLLLKSRFLFRFPYCPRITSPMIFEEIIFQNQQLVGRMGENKDGEVNRKILGQWGSPSIPPTLQETLVPYVTKEALDPSVQSDNNLTIVDIVIVQGAPVGSH